MSWPSVPWRRRCFFDICFFWDLVFWLPNFFFSTNPITKCYKLKNRAAAWLAFINASNSSVCSASSTCNRRSRISKDKRESSSLLALHLCDPTEVSGPLGTPIHCQPWTPFFQHCFQTDSGIQPCCHHVLLAATRGSRICLCWRLCQEALPLDSWQSSCLSFLWWFSHELLLLMFVAIFQTTILIAQKLYIYGNLKNQEAFPNNNEWQCRNKRWGIMQKL